MADAAFRIPGKNEYYVFAGRQYGRVKFAHNSHDNELVTGPTLIRKGWKTPEGFGRVDTVVPVPGEENHLYAFFGNHYVKVKLDDHTDTFDVKNTSPLKNGWNSLVKAGFDTVDAAMLVPGSKSEIYFFSGLNYVRVDSSTDKLVLEVSPIKSGWPSIAKAGFDSVDTIVPSLRHPGHYYVFYGDQFAVIALDKARHDTLISAARPIGEVWKSLDGWL